MGADVGPETSAGTHPGRCRRGWRHRRRLRRALLALALVLVAFLLDAVWVATMAARGAADLRRDLRRGTDALVDGRLDDAEGSFRLAGQAARGIAGVLRHPAGWALALLPWVGDDIRAARAVAGASEAVAQAGTSLVAAARVVGWDGEDLPGLEAGAVDLDVIRRASPGLASAEEALARARALLDPIPLDGLLGWTRNTVVDARAELARREGTVRASVRLAELLPSFLGGEGRRRYLLLLMSLADPRGSGGYSGAYAVLTAEDGRLEVSPFRHAGGLPRVRPVPAPADVQRRFGRFGATRTLISATYPPDFPQAARLALGIYEAATGRRLDGVIGADSVWLSYLLEALGPVETPAWPEPLTAGNVSDVIDRQTYLLPADRTNLVQGRLGDTVFRALLGRRPDALALARALARATAERHLQVYSETPVEQALLEELGAAGRFELGSNPLAVVLFGASPNRVGSLVERELAYVATVHPDGSAEVAITVRLTNRAPTGPPSILLGEQDEPGAPVGSWFAWVNVYLPQGAEALGFRGLTEEELRLVEREGGRSVALLLIRLLPGETRELTVRAIAPPAQGPPGEYTVRVTPQAWLTPAAVSVEVRLPSGAQVAASHGFQPQSGVVRWEGEPATPVELWVRWE